MKIQVNKCSSNTAHYSNEEFPIIINAYESADGSGYVSVKDGTKFYSKRDCEEISSTLSNTQGCVTKRAMRFNTGKRKWSLVDFDSLEDMVKVLEFGAEKYSPHNWKKGLSTTEICESMIRHLKSYLNGENLDPESGLPHTGHIMCNSMFLSHMHNFKKEFDDRFLDK